jgi:uncharacterized repeat protein (TIGR01451 family)
MTTTGFIDYNGNGEQDGSESLGGGDLQIQGGAIQFPPDLSITKVGTPPVICVGGTITYTIVVTTTSQVVGAVVTDTFPTGLDVQWTSTVTDPIGKPQKDIPPDTVAPSTGSGNINALVNLTAGHSATFTVTAIVGELAPCNLENTATVTYLLKPDPNPANNQATTTT